MQNTAVLENEQSSQYKLMGIEMKYFIPITIVVLAATYLGVLPKGMLGAFPLMMILGAILNEIGNKTPIVKDYFGGGPIVVIFASAALISYGVIPENGKTIMTSFMKGEGFLNFYIAALITGSILGMNRKLLIKAALRYLPVIIGGGGMCHSIYRSHRCTSRLRVQKSCILHCHTNYGWRYGCRCSTSSSDVWSGNE